MEAMIITAKIYVFPWAHKNLNNEADGHPFAHLLYYLVKNKELEELLVERD